VTTDYLRPVLEAALLEHGVDAVVRSGDFGQLEEAVLDPGSWLAELGPDVVVVLGSTLAVPGRPEETWRELVERRTTLCRLVADRLGADTIVTTLEPLPEHSGPAGAPSWVAECNAELRRSLPERAFVFDLASVVAEAGLDRWFDLRLWSMARQSVDLNCVPLLADRLAGLVRALFDPPVKLIVTDLDNTMWGGTVAEVGAEAVQLDGNDSGIAHLRLQQFLRECARQGFLVAVCSKNTEEAARGPFGSRPEMLLDVDDFVDFRVSFLPKSGVLPQIAESLNLGLQNVLFLDDEPHERAEMRDVNPEVLVPEWPEDGIVGLPALLARTGWTARVRVTASDRERLESYRRESARRARQTQFANVDEFLASLELTARLTPVRPENLDRVAQLVQKTNQFNLTTWRATRRELEELVQEPGAYARAVHVADRYGPYGLTGVLLARPRDAALVIELWLMSCRVMGKTIEYAMFEDLLEYARASGFRTIEGLFRPTQKNGPVAGLYPDLGFAPAGADGDARRYELAVGSPAKRREHQVKVIDETPEHVDR
jgi:FkbH-like protein